MTESITMQIETKAPKIARPGDLSYDLAYRAHCGTSFVPDKRAKQRQEEYADDVNGTYAQLWDLCTNDRQREVLAEQMERYRRGYLKHIGAFLASHSNVMSTMITGPANFPVARNEKRSQWAHNKLERFLEWRKKANNAIRRAILANRTAEEIHAAEWSAFRSDLMRSLSVIAGIDSGAEFYTRSLFVSSISGKIERLAQAGDVALVDKALELVREYNASHKKPAITARHKFWTFSDLARRQEAAHDAKLDQPDDTITQAEGVAIVVNHGIDRVQIVFDDKPSADVCRRLRGSGWNFSRTNMAWQRKITGNAIESAKSIVCTLAQTAG